MTAVGEVGLHQKVRDYEQGVRRKSDLQGVEQELGCE
jgi:hypothetical protein